MSVMLVGNKGYVGSRLEKYLESTSRYVAGIEYDSPCMDSITGQLKSNYQLPKFVDTIIYLAQSPFYRKDNAKPSHLMTVNVANAVRFAELAVQSGIRRFIYASTGNVYAPSFGPLREDAPLARDTWYALSKIHAEEALRLFVNDLDLTVVRPFGIYGPGQLDKLVPVLLKRLAEGQEILIDRNPSDPDDLDGLKISLCYVDDAVRMLSDLIEAPDIPIVNLAGEEAASIRSIASMAAAQLGVKPRFRITEKYRMCDLIADNSYLKTLLNPSFTSLGAGISETAKGYALTCHSDNSV